MEVRTIKKHIFNKVMFLFSIVYLIVSSVLVGAHIIKFGLSNLFNTDGLTLFGCVFALGELILSKRNFISKKINELIIKNKQVNFRIDISLISSKENIRIKDISDKFEEVISSNLEISDLNRRSLNRLTDSRWEIKYESIGLEIKYLLENNRVDIIFKGMSKYGKIDLKDKEILYLSLLVKLIANEFLQDNDIRRLLVIKKIDIILNLAGSQIKLNNIFNEDLNKVDNYSIKITNGLCKNSEVVISSNQIRLSVLNEGSLFDGFIDLSNIICNID